MNTLLFMMGIGGMESLVLFLIITILWLWALIDVVKSNFKGSTKIVWVLLILILPLLGSILYLIIGRKQKV